MIQCRSRQGNIHVEIHAMSLFASNATFYDSCYDALYLMTEEKKLYVMLNPRLCFIIEDAGWRLRQKLE